MDSVATTDRDVHEAVAPRLMRSATALVGPDDAADDVSAVVIRAPARRKLSTIEKPEAYLMRSGRVGFDQTVDMLTTEIAEQFPAGPGYLNTSAVGLPPQRALSVLRRHLEDWASGRCDPASFDVDVDRARAAHGKLVGVESDAVAIVNAVSAVSGLVASSLPTGAQVLCAEEDFTSVLFPFLVDGRHDVRLVPLEQLIDSITDETTLVAVSAAQSADGRLVDLESLREVSARHGTRTYVDVTQAAGWLPDVADGFDVTACGAYKWLCSPRGTGFITVSPDCDWLVPRNAGWYSSDRPWESIYGPPLRLADDARRYNLSPPWFDIAAAAEAVELLVETGVYDIQRHSVGLANDFRDRLGLPPSNSPVVALETDRGQALVDAGIRGSVRAGKVRLCFHLYNTAADVDTAVRALMG